MFNIKDFDKQKYLDTLKQIKNTNLNTICIEANCPNRYECFSKNTATFLVLGNICTRNCKYCNVKKGIIGEDNLDEKQNILNAIDKMKLEYVVLTQVTRDDLGDSGASYISDLVKAIKSKYENVKVEVLISDLKGNTDDLEIILDSKPDVLNHNIEVVERLFESLRSKGSYIDSLKILNHVKKYDDNIKVKSGLMVGFDENNHEIEKTLSDLNKNGVDIVTIGQYLRPNSDCVKVSKMYSEEEFKQLSDLGLSIGLSKVIAGRFVRSSYEAKESYDGS